MTEIPRNLSDVVRLTPEQSAARRAASEARSAEFDIDAVLADNSSALSEMGIITSPEQQRRNRNQQALERIFPGLTEDEQTVSGMYEPSPKNYPKDITIEYPSMEAWDEQGHDPINMFSISHYAKGEGQDSDRRYPTHQVIDLNPELNTPTRNSRIYPFEEHLVGSNSTWVGGGVYSRDRENAINWTKQHREEFARTGNADTEGKRRLGQLLSDVVNYNPPSATKEAHITANDRNLDFIKTLYERTDDTNIDLDSSLKTGKIYETSEPRTPITRSASTRTTNRANRVNRASAGPVTNRNEAALRMVRGEPARSGGRAYGVHNFRGQQTAVPQRGDSYTVFSYHTPIGWRRHDNNNWVVSTENYSKSTNRHQSALRNALAQTNHRSPEAEASSELMSLYYKQGSRRRLPKRLFDPEFTEHTFTTDHAAAEAESRRIVNEHLENVVIPEIQKRDAKYRTPAKMRRAGQMELPFGDSNA